jgi:hypothetical protein
MRRGVPPRGRSPGPFQGKRPVTRETSNHDGAVLKVSHTLLVGNRARGGDGVPGGNGGDGLRLWEVATGKEFPLPATATRAR